jgi:hypothetical protein
MRRVKVFPKVFGCFMAFLLAFTSCTPASGYKPGSSELPIPDETNGYTLVELDPNVYPEQSTSMEQVTSTIENTDGTFSGSYLVASASTDANGVVLFSDPTLSLPVPVVIMDSNNEPVENSQVNILDRGDVLVVSVRDPQQRHAPTWAVVEKSALLETSAALQYHQQASPFVRGTVLQAGAVVHIIAILLVVLVIYSIVDTAATFIQMTRDPVQVMRVSDYEMYECKTPEQIGREADFLLSMVFMFLPAGKVTKPVKLLIETGKTLASKAVGIGLATSIKSPILYHQYYVNPDTLDVIVAGEGYDPSEYNYSGMLMYVEAGTCAFVPDVVNQSLEEATHKLDEGGLAYEVTYVDKFRNPMIYGLGNASDLLTVIEQSPLSTELFYWAGYDPIEQEVMLPMGSYPGLNSIVMLTVMVDTQTSSLDDPSQGQESGNNDGQDDTLYLVLDRNYFCNEGPGKTYPAVTAYPTGTRLPVIGTDGAGWWQVKVEGQRLPSCWVGGGAVDGNAARVPVVVAPPPPPDESLGTGDVQVTLYWYSTNDLDLVVVDPYGEEIYFSNPFSSSGGILDVDANPACHQVTTQPVENIYWPVGAAPEGEYTVKVRYYSQCEANASTPFEVHILVDGVTTVLQGITQFANDEQVITSFDR